MPTQPAATDIRPLASADIATENPLPSGPSMALAGTRTPSRTSSAVAWPRSPSLPWISRRVSPGASAGTRNALTPLWPAPPVRAKSSTTSAHVPLVMNILLPVIVYVSPSRTARVVRLAASEPVPGSVSPKQPTASPEVSRGSQARLLLLAPPVRDGLGDQAERDGDDAAHGGVAAAQLLGDQAVRQVVAAGAAVLLADGQAEEAERAELLDDAAVDALGAVPGDRVRGDLPVGELPGQRLYGGLLLGQLKVHWVPPF